MSNNSDKLLAIDLGVRSGLALFGRDGRLIWYRSTNFGSRGRLKRAAYGVLRKINSLSLVVAEGDATLGDIWQKNAEKLGARFQRIHAETWRDELLFKRHRRNARDAKHQADVLAREVIAWSNLPGPTSLRHDAAEAILVGVWAAKNAGWVDKPPI